MFVATTIACISSIPTRHVMTILKFEFRDFPDQVLGSFERKNRCLKPQSTFQIDCQVSVSGGVFKSVRKTGGVVIVVNDDALSLCFTDDANFRIIINEMDLKLPR